MISIKNKEAEECVVLLVDMNGNVCYKTQIQPFDILDIDIRKFLSGIYTLIFATENTSFQQQIVKY
jgi:hypothetical protein